MAENKFRSIELSSNKSFFSDILDPLSDSDWHFIPPKMFFKNFKIRIDPRTYKNLKLLNLEHRLF